MATARFMGLRAAIAAGLLAVACSSDKMTAPKAAQPLDLKPILAKVSLGNLGSASARRAAGPAGALGSTSTPPVPGDCSYSPQSKSFICPPVTVDGITFTWTFALYDDNGNPQSQPDANTTASIRVISTTKGTITPPSSGGTSGSVTVDRRDDMTMRGLNADHLTLNGTSISQLDGSVTSGGTTQTYSLAQTDHLLNVVLPPVSANALWPLSGQIQSDLITTIGTGNQARRVPIRLMLTFNGSGIVDLKVTINGTTLTCLLDLTNPTAGPACAG
ncbi:MAG TPA: hypothetical protein VHE78_05495 [Gemmatimonadaceae bacterium]|nr:hypothetical protein [Gemmatimonadaceae bacterium]